MVAAIVKHAWSLLLAITVVGDFVTASYQDNSESNSNGKATMWNTTWTDTLKRDLLSQYDKFARPSQHTNITTITLDLTFRHVHLDDKKSLMTVNAWVKMTWKDEKLRWNSSEYGGLEKLHLADHEIWEPDIVLYNSATGNNIDHYGNTHLLAFPDGTVLWVPPSQFAVFCEMDLTRWPFDRHTCMLRLGSWTYGGDQLDLQTNSSKAVEMDLDPSEWKVINITKTRSVTFYSCCQEPYMDITYRIKVARVSASFTAVIITPAIAFALMILSTFWLPGSFRFLVAAMAALLLTIFLVYFAQRLPVFGAHTPLIVLFYSYSLVMVAVAMIISIITHRMSTAVHTKPVPWIVRNFFTAKLATILWVPKRKVWAGRQNDRPEELTDRSTLDEGEDAAGHAGGPARVQQTSHEWNLLAAVIDRTAFLVYLIIYICFALRAALW